MKPVKSSRSRAATNEASLCQFPFADGRTCRMMRHPAHPSLCIFHSRAERQLLESDRLGSEIASSLTGGFMTSTDVNFVLGKLFTAFAQNRISQRNAATLAYIGQLMLHSVQGIQEEYKFKYDFDAWKRMEDDAIPLSDSSPEVSSRDSQNA
jgi:hypothetical protein